MKNANSAAILGAIVADSAALGLHWLYDPVRIAEIEAAKGLAFLQPEPVDYAGTKATSRTAGRRSASLPATVRSAY